MGRSHRFVLTRTAFNQSDYCIDQSICGAVVTCQKNLQFLPTSADVYKPHRIFKSMNSINLNRVLCFIHDIHITAGAALFTTQQYHFNGQAWMISILTPRVESDEWNSWHSKSYRRSIVLSINVISRPYLKLFVI